MGKKGPWSLLGLLTKVQADPTWEGTLSWTGPYPSPSKSLSTPPIQRFSYPEKEEKKKWKDLKLMKKLERQQAQEEQAKLQQEEEAAAQREDQGEQAGSWAGTSMSYLEGTLETSGSRHLVLMEKLRPREWEN